MVYYMVVDADIVAVPYAPAFLSVLSLKFVIPLNNLSHSPVDRCVDTLAILVKLSLQLGHLLCSELSI